MFFFADKMMRLFNTFDKIKSGETRGKKEQRENKGELILNIKMNYDGLSEEMPMKMLKGKILKGTFF